MSSTLDNTCVIVYMLTKGNPGAIAVMTKITEDDAITHAMAVNFYERIILLRIFGDRLWYIYKNEFAYSAYSLVTADLSRFTDEYFYDKYERFTRALDGDNRHK